MNEWDFETSAGVTLRVAESGSQGPPIVLLHGVTRRWQDWLLVLPYLMPAWRVFALDLRGHGRSSRTPGAYRVADYVPDVVDFLERGIGSSESAIVFGHSLGGNVAALAASEAPTRVRGLVLEDPPLEMAGPRLAETPFPSYFRAFAPHAGSDRPLSAIAADLAETPVDAPLRAGTVRMGDIRDAVSIRVSAAGLKRLDPAVLEPALAGVWTEDSPDLDLQLALIACPTLLVQADPTLGGILPDDHAAEMTARIPDCLHLKLRGLGHNLHSTATETLMRLVIPFLSSLD